MGGTTLTGKKKKKHWILIAKREEWTTFKERWEKALMLGYCFSYEKVGNLIVPDGFWHATFSTNLKGILKNGLLPASVLREKGQVRSPSCLSSSKFREWSLDAEGITVAPFGCDKEAFAGASKYVWLVEDYGVGYFFGPKNSPFIEMLRNNEYPRWNAAIFFAAKKIFYFELPVELFDNGFVDGEYRVSRVDPTLLRYKATVFLLDTRRPGEEESIRNLAVAVDRIEELIREFPQYRFGLLYNAYGADTFKIKLFEHLGGYYGTHPVPILLYTPTFEAETKVVREALRMILEKEDKEGILKLAMGEHPLILDALRKVKVETRESLKKLRIELEMFERDAKKLVADVYAEITHNGLRSYVLPKREKIEQLKKEREALEMQLKNSIRELKERKNELESQMKSLEKRPEKASLLGTVAKCLKSPFLKRRIEEELQRVNEEIEKLEQQLEQTIEKYMNMINSIENEIREFVENKLKELRNEVDCLEWDVESLESLSSL